MIEGQYMDISFEGSSRITVDQYMEMISRKTGALLRSSVHLGAVLGSGSDEVGNLFRRIGAALGFMFQIRDDILDVEGATDIIGKPSGSDAGLGKATWPGLFGLGESKRRCDRLLAHAVESLSTFGNRAEPLRYLAKLIVSRDR